MPDPQALADGGLIVVLLTFISAVVVGAIRGDWVPGYLYRAAVARAEKAEAALEHSLDTVDANTETMKAVLHDRDRAKAG